MTETNGLIKLTGLWKRDGENGPFYSGKLSGSANVLIFKNQYKRTDSDPDLILFVGKAKEREKPREEEGPKDGDIPF